MTSTAGSRWLKCDLHVHTPASFEQSYGNREQQETWDKFFDALEALPSEIKMVGINDYLTIEGYKRVLEAKKNGRLKNLDCILPVVEFRINRFAGQSEFRRINYHVIFSETVSPDVIETQFLNRLSAGYKLESDHTVPDWTATVSDSSFIELGDKLKALSPENTTLQNESSWRVGFNNFNVDCEQLKTILKSDSFRGRYLTALGKSEWDSHRWDGGGAGDKRTLINEANFVFLAAPTVSNYDKAKEYLVNQRVNTLLLDCSDSHFYADDTKNQNKLGNCNTWLKIEPTFEGLKQIIFEPEGRVAVSEIHPDKKAPYQVIKSVQFVNGDKVFTDKVIELSPYLNSIIGGKSTGKSLLAGMIVKSADPEEFKRRHTENKRANALDWVTKENPQLDFVVTWADGTKTNLANIVANRKVSYFPQHYLNNKIDGGVDNKELNKIIRVILSQTPEFKAAFDKYELQLSLVDSELAADCASLEHTLREWRQQKHSAQEKGKSSDIKANLNKLTGEFNELKTQYGLTEDEVESHKKYSETLKNLSAAHAAALKDAAALAELDTETIKAHLTPVSFFEEEFAALSQDVAQKLAAELTQPFTSLAALIEKTFSNQEKIERAKADVIHKEIENLKAAHSAVLDKIKNSAPLREKTDLIKEEQRKLEDATSYEGKIATLLESVMELKEKLPTYIDKKIALTKEIVTLLEKQSFGSDKSELSIKIEPLCKSEHIQGTLRDRIKFVSNPAIKAFINDEAFADRELEAYKERVAAIILQAIAGEVETKGDHKASSIIQELLSNGLYLNYDLRLGADSFNVMSPGKRALALLRILIELDSSLHPIVLDQPEDDLDNRSIYEGLAKYIKKKKLTRQVIVVTHNPNVVVGSDSEFVVVANQSGQETNKDNRTFKFEYIYGGLENSFEDKANAYILEKQGIRQHVCEILDGGADAFKRREQLYAGLSQP